MVIIERWKHGFEEFARGKDERRWEIDGLVPGVGVITTLEFNEYTGHGEDVDMGADELVCF